MTRKFSKQRRKDARFLRLCNNPQSDLSGNHDSDENTTTDVATRLGCNHRQSIPFDYFRFDLILESRIVGDAETRVPEDDNDDN
jgi:hypothetical protein